MAFANGMMHIFIEEDLIDHKFIEDRTENFEAMKEMVKDYTPEKVGIDLPDRCRYVKRSCTYLRKS